MHASDSVTMKLHTLGAESVEQCVSFEREEITGPDPLCGAGMDGTAKDEAVGCLRQEVMLNQIRHIGFSTANTWMGTSISHLWLDYHKISEGYRFTYLL
jgi:hypothetical protein